MAIIAASHMIVLGDNYLHALRHKIEKWRYFSKLLMKYLSIRQKWFITQSMILIFISSMSSHSTLMIKSPNNS